MTLLGGDTFLLLVLVEDLLYFLDELFGFELEFILEIDMRNLKFMYVGVYNN